MHPTIFVSRSGPDLRSPDGADGRLCHLLIRALDEVDYGVALLRADGHVLHMNDAARRRLEAGLGLALSGACLYARHAHAAARFADALRAAAQAGSRCMVDVGNGEGEAEELVALVPMEPHVAALLLGRTGHEDLAIEHFAHMHHLTPAEGRVLAALNAGASPTAIALAQGVKLSTVRSQIGAIREKTGAPSIMGLLRLVAGLPPMVNALHH
jgi:DNA-binding CsgD family transcriptional regulator